MHKKMVAFTAMALLLSVLVSAQVSWVGAGDGSSWNDPANWSGAAVPIATDDVILDNVTILTSYDVTLPLDGSTVSVNSITILPTAASIRLLVPAASTSNPALEVTGPGNSFLLNSGGSLINAGNSNVTFDGNFILTGTASADFSSGGGSPLVVIKGNFSVAAANAITETGTGNPILEFNGSNQTITSFPGAFTGNNLDVIIDETGTLSLLTNVFFPHSLSVVAGTVDISSAALNAANVLGVKGDLNIQGMITESGTGLPRITLNGTTNQNITVSAGGSITGDNLDFRLNNAAGATLLSDLVLPYQYTISAGNLTLGNFSLTTPYVQQFSTVPLATNHIITNGSGFLIIPNVVSNASFPIGVDATSANDVKITNGEGLTYSIRVNAGVTPAISLPLFAIDRTWTINTNATPTNPIIVGFNYYPDQGTTNFNYAGNIDIGQYTPSAWSIIENNIQPSLNGSQYQIAALISSFNTPFVIGNHGAILPIDFMVICKAQKKEAANLISWNVGSQDQVSRYEIERSVKGEGFKLISTLLPDEKTLAYNITDPKVADGNTFYRVKVIMDNGRFRYSNIVALAYNTKSLLITSVAPNPVHSSAMLTISSPANASMILTLYNVQGRIVKQWREKFVNGTNFITLEISDLFSGMYFLSGSDGNFKTNVMRILKQ